MKTIYLVVGSTGEYEDYTEWIVCAYDNPSQAAWHAKHATKEAGRLKKLRKETRGSNYLDPEMRVSFNGTTYEVQTVNLRLTVPKKKKTA